MSVFATLIRKHLAETRWVFGISCAAFFGLAVLSTWLTVRIERVMEEAPGLAATGDQARRGRGLGFARALGGPAMDFSSLALEVSFWNHPLIVLTVLGWSITRGAAAVGGEIERGSLDLVLSRPVSRSSFLSSHIVFALLGILALATALIAGDMVGSRIFAVKSPPSLVGLLKPAIMVVALGMSAYGYTLPFSTIDLVRWRPSLIASALTLGGLIAMTVSRSLEGYDWLEKLSIFKAYAPVTVAVTGDAFAYNTAVLAGVFATGVALSFLAFSGRDLPTNS